MFITKGNKKMEPIKFKGMNQTYAEGQPEYIPLPVWKEDDGGVTSVWELDEEEKKRILEHGFICLKQSTFNQALQPVNLWIPEKEDVTKIE